MHSSEKKKTENNTDVSGWDELVKNLNARLKLETVKVKVNKNGNKSKRRIHGKNPVGRSQRRR